jgi:hypothetical protein
VLLRQLKPVEPIGIRLRVVADGGHNPGLATQQIKVVRDVARAAAELAAHFRHQERDVENMQLLGEDVLLEAARETP